MKPIRDFPYPSLTDLSGTKMQCSMRSWQGSSKTYGFVKLTTKKPNIRVPFPSDFDISRHRDSFEDIVALLYSSRYHPAWQIHVSPRGPGSCAINGRAGDVVQ